MAMKAPGAWSAGVVAIIAATFVLLGGCGGTEGGPAAPQPPPPPVGTATITGVVLDASNIAQAIAYAVVTATPPGVSVQAGADGSFVLRRLPAGDIQLAVQPGPTGAYWPTELTVRTQANQTTQVVVTLVPQQLGVPDRVLVQPNQVTLDPGAQQQFIATVWAGPVTVNITPSWIVEGGVGTIAATGLFTATTAGQGKVIAVAGPARGEAAVTVTGPQPPKIWSAFIDPQQLPPTGGLSTFTLHATDGDGITSVQAEVYKPDGSHDTVNMALVTGSDKDGTWTGGYNFPRNTAAPDPTGHQPDQIYDVRFVVRDASGAVSRRNASTGQEWYQVVVQGVEPPPPPAS